MDRTSIKLGVIKCALLLLLLFAPLYSVAAQQEDTLTQLSQTINDKFLSLKQEIATLQNDLSSTTQLYKTASTALSLSTNERQELEQRSTNLSISLDNITEQYNSLLTNTERYKQRIQQNNHVFVVLGLIGATIIAFKLIAFMLYIKGIKTPRWLDILL